MDVEGTEARVVAVAKRLTEKNRPIVTTERTRDMRRDVSAVSSADYLGYFDPVGYPHRPGSMSGVEKLYASMAPLLDDRRGRNERCDVLLVPSGE
jgi:hypothetical protein